MTEGAKDASEYGTLYLSFNLGFQLKVEYECLSCSKCLGENTGNARNLTQDRLLAAGSQHCWIPLSQYLLLDMLPYILMGHIPILKKIACVFSKNLNEFCCCTIFPRLIQAMYFPSIAIFILS